MSIHIQAHTKAIKDVIELMAIASAVALIADCFWIVRDIMADGFTPGRILVMVLLDIGLLIQMYALIRFHKQLKDSIVNIIKGERKRICKLKVKHDLKVVKKGGVK